MGNLSSQNGFERATSVILGRIFIFITIIGSMRGYYEYSARYRAHSRTGGKHKKIFGCGEFYNDSVGEIRASF
jgi:hypothetical protein